MDKQIFAYNQNTI